MIREILEKIERFDGLRAPRYTELMKSFVLSLALVSLVSGVAVPVFADGTCVQGVQSSRDVQIQTIALTDGEGPSATPGCDVMLTPLSSATSYRGYTISQRGVVQIFNVFDLNDPDISKSTGARSYFFFPRRAVPSATILSDGNVQVTTSSGVKLNFNAGKLADASGPATLPSFLSEPNDPILATEIPEISPSNDGGVTLTQTPRSGTLILDTGFMMGNASFTNPNGTSTFIDPRGNRCELKNAEIFSYADTEDPGVAYAKDADLWAFLATRCPNLELPQL